LNQTTGKGLTQSVILQDMTESRRQSV